MSSELAQNLVQECLHALQSHGYRPSVDMKHAYYMGFDTVSGRLGIWQMFRDLADACEILHRTRGVHQVRFERGGNGFSYV